MSQLFPSAEAMTRRRLQTDEVTSLAENYDWSRTPLGPSSDWPEALRWAVRFVLASRVPMLLLAGPDDGVLIYNSGYIRFAGTRHPAIFGMRAGEAWPEASDVHAENLRRGLAGESWDLSNVELALEGGGGTLAVDLHYSPILGEDGVPVALATTVHEIRQPQPAESELRLRTLAEEREVLAQELSHRIKNIFSVIAGIVALSARTYPEIKSYADDLRDRILALGRAHDFVRPHSRASLRPVDPRSFAALFAELMQPYQDRARDRVLFAGEDAQIDDRAATPLALLFHELATNAAKYGALVHATGQVSVIARRVGDRYALSWKERGGTPPAAMERHRAGFGSRLIGLTAESQLRGKVTRHWEDDGLRVEIELPLASLAPTSAG